jgi:hypothetical protein
MAAERALGYADTILGTGRDYITQVVPRHSECLGGDASWIVDKYSAEKPFRTKTSEPFSESLARLDSPEHRSTTAN